MARLAQVPFVNPAHLVPDIAGGFREGLETGSSLLNFLQKSKEMKRKEGLQSEVSKAYEDYQTGLKTIPELPTRPSPVSFEWSPEQIDQYQEMAGMRGTPLDRTLTESRGLGMVPGQVTQEQADRFHEIVKKNYAAESPWAAEKMGPAPQAGLADFSENQKYQEALEKIKSYPHEKRAEYLNKLKDIYMKYGETDKANDLDKRFLDTIKTLARFSPKAAAEFWNKTYPDRRIDEGSIRRFGKGELVKFGPNNDGLVRMNIDGDPEILREPTAKTEKPKTHFVFYNNPVTGQRKPFEIPIQTPPDGWLTDKEIDRHIAEKKEKKTEEKDIRKEGAIEARHKETFAETKARREQAERHFKEREAVGEKRFDVKQEAAKEEYVSVGKTDEPEPRTIWQRKGKPEEYVKDDEGKLIPWEKGKVRPRTERPKASLDDVMNEILGTSPPKEKTTPQNHPLTGKNPGRYKVNGKIINWNGKKEI